MAYDAGLCGEVLGILVGTLFAWLRRTAKTDLGLCRWVTLAHGAAQAGLRTLLMDLDPQGNATQHLGVEGKTNAYHMFTDAAEPVECIHVARERRRSRNAF